MDNVKKQNALVAEYEWLRQYNKALDLEANLVDARLVEIERVLPDDYTFADDPPGLDERR